MLIGLFGTIRRHQVARVEHDIRGECGTGLYQLADHRIFVGRFDCFQIDQCRADEGIGDFRILDAFVIPLHRRRIYLASVMEQHAFAQFEFISHQIIRG
jgi:hypothetical protein